MIEPLKGIRTKILHAIHRHGMQTSTELAELLGVDRRAISDNAAKAKGEGYLSTQRDDVTGQLAYVLTPRGRARVENGSICGMRSVEKNVEAEIEPDRAPPAEPAANYEALMRRIQELEADLAEARRTASAPSSPPEDTVEPACWLHVWDGGHTAFETEAEAREHIEAHSGEWAILAAQVATAKRSVVWG